ncbi:MAG: ABC transporter permease, partial [Acidobacteriota bacterium]|nr:ABC transporter permease [Acidobacteriota bacterium]
MAGTPLQISSQAAPKPAPKPTVTEVLIDSLKGWISNVQDYSMLAGRSLRNLATGPRYFQDLLDQMDDIGVGSLPIVLLSGFFIGAVMVLQTGSQFTRFGQAAL